MSMNLPLPPAPPVLPPPAPVPVPAPPEPEPAVIAFALSPGQATPGIREFQSRRGMDVYHRAIQGPDVKFDGQATNLQLFLLHITKSVQRYDLTCLRIPRNLTYTTTGRMTDMKDFLVSYHEFTLAQITTWEESYLDTRTRIRQDSDILYNLILNSITPDFEATIMQNQTLFTFTRNHQQQQQQQQPVHAGVCLLRAIIDVSTMGAAEADIALRNRRLLSLQDLATTTTTHCGTDNQATAPDDDGDTLISAFLTQVQMTENKPQLHILANKWHQDKNKNGHKPNYIHPKASTAWLWKAPTSTDSTCHKRGINWYKTTDDGREWIWCTHHKKWGTHDSNDCRKGKPKHHNAPTSDGTPPHLTTAPAWW